MAEKEQIAETPSAILPIVAVGASAGGVEALSDFLDNLPAITGLAFLLIQHRDPEHSSLLTEILARKSAMPLVEIQDGMTAKPGVVHVVPANRALTLDGETLRLHDRDTPERRRMPIDLMFSSLAEERGQNSIAIVLSGTGSDGASGIREIKAVGGITFAQDPASAKFNGMPNKAIETGCVDFVCSAKEIAREIEKIAQHPYLRQAVVRTHGDLSADENSLRKIFRLLQNHAHLDFSHYKRSTIQRRINRRMAMRQKLDLTEYAELLRDDQGEINALAQDFLISVTGFFRDPATFTGLTKIVFPALLKNLAPKEPLRIWVPGCATGEEVYSIAMTLVEFLSEQATAPPVQIFGTDLSETAIQKARSAEYVDNIEAEVSTERLRRFFIKLDDHYQVAKSIREMCIFAHHNVTYDPPFSRIGLLCCRNLLIYFDSSLQQKVIHSFHYALKPRGFLAVGPAESINQFPDLFQQCDKRYQIYSNDHSVSYLAADHPPRGPLSQPLVDREQVPAQSGYVPPARGQREVERLLLARYAPPCVLIDDNLNILYFQGEADLFLHHARGAATLDLRKLARPGLVINISSAVEEARKKGVPVRRADIGVEISGQPLNVDIDVTPVRTADSETTLFLVVFEKTPPAARAPKFGRSLARWWAQMQLREARSSETEKELRIRQLLHEVESTRDYLQAAMEAHETIQEELKSAHEEALSANEEFQSTNEELETAKEELQSSNEELATTNEELRNRNRELQELNSRLQASRDHLKAIYATLHEPVLILDAGFRVVEANPAFYRHFQTTPTQTENHFLYDIGGGQWNIAALRHLLDDILPKNQLLTDYEISHAFPPLGDRTMLLNARRLNSSDMIFLAINDITEQHALLAALREADLQKDRFLAMLAHELRNPLAPIENALHIIRLKGDENSAQQRARHIIERQLGQLTRLLADLLEVSRITSGTVVLQPEYIELHELVARAVETSRPLIDQRQHQLTVSLPEQSLSLYVDPTRLEQVLINLLNNAAKYTEIGGHITLTVECEPGTVIVRVRDNGVGIEDDLIQHIFEIFTQSRRDLARSRGGLGVGLSVSKSIVELHGGTIDAHSDGPGTGSEFIVRLPITSAGGKLS